MFEKAKQRAKALLKVDVRAVGHAWIEVLKEAKPSLKEKYAKSCAENAQQKEDIENINVMKRLSKEEIIDLLKELEEDE